MAEQQDPGKASASGIDGLLLLQRTRRLTVLTVVLLSVQLAGNLYEEVVTNVLALTRPLHYIWPDEFEPGSPVYFYIPWAAVGIVLAVVLAARLQRLAPARIARHAWVAIGLLGVNLAAKAFLIANVNPHFRDPNALPDEIRRFAVIWGVGNGIAILTVAAAIVLLTYWRPRTVDRYVASLNEQV